MTEKMDSREKIIYLCSEFFKETYQECQSVTRVQHFSSKIMQKKIRKYSVKHCDKQTI